MLTQDLLQLLILLLVPCSQLFNISIMFLHEFCSDSVHHIISILLMNPLRPKKNNKKNMLIVNPIDSK